MVVLLRALRRWRVVGAVTVTDSPIYTALNGLVAAQRDLIAMLHGTTDEMERREIELREAHLELATALNRRVDALHTRIDEMERKR